ncbi:Proline iminopeptidase [Halomonadaceae bacterium LMG 33818]|uniref:alpha/beta fold hydrolase n=1 Tax=Cernens ardua TaxID=3402176 RepID=UPI003EDBE45A
MPQPTRMGDMLLTDHSIDVPLDHDHPEKGTIQVFYREVCHVSHRDSDLPLLIFLQGGPGGSSPRLNRWGMGWVNEAIQHYRVILPDQRGTGRSSRISSKTISRFENSEEASRYLALFDARAIIDDFEVIRKRHYDGQRWATLGQSYGGFLTLSYLSFAPEALLRCYITGGLPSIDPDPDELYRRTYPRVEQKLADYYQRFPGDEAQINQIADFLRDNYVCFPNGDPFTVRRFQTLGMMLGMQAASDQLHWLLEAPFTDETCSELDPYFILQVQIATGMDGAPLYAALQENIYADPARVTNWSAQRLRNERPQFDEHARPLCLTGEMVYPWMFDEIQALRPFRDAVHQLARTPGRKPLYDKAILAENTVPIAAAIYDEDLYVDRELSLATARHIPHLHYWLTNEYEHDGLRTDDRVFKRLFNLLQGR